MAENTQDQRQQCDKENISLDSNFFPHLTSKQSLDEDKQTNLQTKKRKINDNNAIKTNPTVKKVEWSCKICQQPVQTLKFHENNLPNAVFEDVALTDEKLHLSIDGEILQDDFIPTYKLINFSVYDEEKHLCRFDTGLIEDNVPLYCCGYIVPIFEDDPSSPSQVPAINIGPINEWYTTGFDGGENVLVCISTAFAEYYLIKPSTQYQSFMHPVYEKAYMSKLVIEFLTTKDDPTYEDLIDELQTVDPPEGMPRFTEESLLNNVQFICDQVTSLDIDSDESENVFPLLTTSCMRSLVKLTGVTVGTKLKLCKPQQKSPAKRKKSWTTPASTKLVKEVFEKFFPKSLSTNNITSGSCGVCAACQKPDCGVCPACKRRKKSKTSRTSNLVCVKRRCPNKAIEDADSDSGDDESSPASLQSTFQLPKTTLRLTKPMEKNVKWLGEPLDRQNRRIYYKSAEVDASKITIGDCVVVDVGNPSTEQIARVVSMWEDDKKEQKVHLNWFLRGKETILGRIAHERELFLVDECTTVSLTCIKRQCSVSCLKIPEKWSQLGNTNPSLDIKGKKIYKDSFFYRKRYIRDSARFVDVVESATASEPSFCMACSRITSVEEFQQPKLGLRGDTRDDRVHYKTVFYRGEEYRPADGVYMLPTATFSGRKNSVVPPTRPKLEEINEDMYPEYYRKYFTGDHVKGSNCDTPEPFEIGRIVSIYTLPPHKSSADIWLEIHRMYRPEDLPEQLQTTVKTQDTLYCSQEVEEITFRRVVGKCEVSFTLDESPEESLHRFYFRKSFDRTQNILLHPPESIPTEKRRGLSNSAPRPLRTLDIFAGCGGLSEGLRNSGVAEVLWAVERDRAAAAAFQVNHSKAQMFHGDCNAILDEVIRGKRPGFPQKGEVELLCGGPPCQGFSGLNRFNSSQYSYLKNTLLFTFLSYCDYYRPRFIVMENVHNFTLHSKGFMLKIALYCLLEIGYQCSFAIVQAGHFGLPQSRRRVILLAAAPGENLPMYPEPLYVFSKRASQLDVVIDGKKYSSGCFWQDSAPYRTVSVRDAISDLPAIQNGASVQGVTYGNDAQSDFQRKMRGNARKSDLLYDHICKKMSPLVEARIANVPKAPGADWRDLPNISVNLSDGTWTRKLEYRHLDRRNGKNGAGRLRGVCSCAAGLPCNPLDRQENTLIPWCLPHTANRQYGWAGTYGRLDWNGFFGTTITNPEPLGKQGRVLHPEQSRVVSVRECARSQGFSDFYRFKGSVIDRYRQIGNAVPPPLAEAIGQEIKKCIVGKTAL